MSATVHHNKLFKGLNTTIYIPLVKENIAIILRLFAITDFYIDKQEASVIGWLRKKDQYGEQWLQNTKRPQLKKRFKYCDLSHEPTMVLGSAIFPKTWD